MMIMDFGDFKKYRIILETYAVAHNKSYPIIEAIALFVVDENSEIFEEHNYVIHEHNNSLKNLSNVDIIHCELFSDFCEQLSEIINRYNDATIIFNQNKDSMIYVNNLTNLGCFKMIGKYFDTIEDMNSNQKDQKVTNLIDKYNQVHINEIDFDMMHSKATITMKILQILNDQII